MADKSESPKSVSIKSNAPGIRDDNFVTIYCNSLGLMTSQYDIQLLVNHIQPGGLDGKPIVCEKALISMSPAHAKAAAIGLAKSVKDWEAKFGEIKLQN
jgi:hypothetical protein